MKIWVYDDKDLPLFKLYLNEQIIDKDLNKIYWFNCNYVYFTQNNRFICFVGECFLSN